MATNAFYEMFVDELRDLFDAENQIVQTLPATIQMIGHSSLKDALSLHVEDTKNQIQRLKKIFKTLNENPTGETCKPMQALLNDLDNVSKKDLPTSIKDAYLIICCQKVEHYEIAGYGSVRSIAHHLNDTNINDRVDFDEIADMLQETLDEESAADEKLTDIAEGGFFTKGINEEAQNLQEIQTGSTQKRKTSNSK
jgi:ferritin-like metal-binding protein YciE